MRGKKYSNSYNLFSVQFYFRANVFFPSNAFFLLPQALLKALHIIMQAHGRDHIVSRTYVDYVGTGWDTGIAKIRILGAYYLTLVAQC